MLYRFPDSNTVHSNGICYTDFLTPTLYTQQWYMSYRFPDSNTVHTAMVYDIQFSDSNTVHTAMVYDI